MSMLLNMTCRTINTDVGGLLGGLEKWFGESQRPIVRLDMYYDKKSRDFGLLMDLLAESSGLVQPLRILSMFDRHFQALWQPRCL